MEKQEIKVAGHTVTQLDETEYECENKFQNLDFHFDAGNPDAVEVFVFDSEKPTQGEQDPCITVFYAESLEDAVIKAMSIRRESLLKPKSADINAVVQLLREIADGLAVTPTAGTKTVLFPGWNAMHEEKPEQLIKEAARAILASGVEADEGTHVPLESVAALIHYVADMMEE